MDRLGVFHANQTSMWLNPHLNYGLSWLFLPCGHLLGKD